MSVVSRYVTRDWWKPVHGGQQLWGVFHPTKQHRWVFDLTASLAHKECLFRNWNKCKPDDFCPDCSYSYQLHHVGDFGGIECPSLREQVETGREQGGSMKSKISLKIEYAELYCGGFGCTPNGCPGHKSDFPAAIKLNGFRMALDDCDVDGDKDEKRWKETVKTLEALLS